MSRNHNKKRLARAIQTLDKIFYEKGNHLRCHKQIWRQHGYPLFGMGYGTYMKWLKADVNDLPALKTATVDTLHLLDMTLNPDPEPPQKQQPGLPATPGRTAK